MHKAAVRDLLNDFRGDPLETRHRDAMLALLDREEPFARHHFEPGHFTASAFVLSPDRTQLMLIFHKKLRLWLQPGGHLEPGDESLLGASLREVKEEVGVCELNLARAGIFDVDVHEIPAFNQEPAHQHFDVRFAFVAASTDFVSSDEVAAARWVPLANVSALARDASVLRAVAKLQREALAG
jgi:8-oxo-dGTP pyrophosphatase MutT (NUDIX family)